MSDAPKNDRSSESAAGNDPTPELQSNSNPEMSEEDLEKVSGGVTASDFSFTKKIDKASPTL